MREFDATQLTLTRDTLQRWGAAALPHLRAFLAADKPVLAKALAQLAKDEAYWAEQRARLRGLPLARIAREKEDIQAIRAELSDLADILECSAAEPLSREQIEFLCRIATRRDWPAQNRAAAELLKRVGARAEPIIREHIQRGRLHNPDADHQDHGHQSNNNDAQP